MAAAAQIDTASKPCKTDLLRLQNRAPPIMMRVLAGLGYLSLVLAGRAAGVRMPASIIVYIVALGAINTCMPARKAAYYHPPRERCLPRVPTCAGVENPSRSRFRLHLST